MNAKPVKIPPCPTCGGQLRGNAAANATSRYNGDLHICSACGVREALEGQFWSMARSAQARHLNRQKPWVDASRRELADGTS